MTLNLIKIPNDKKRVIFIYKTMNLQTILFTIYIIFCSIIAFSTYSISSTPSHAGVEILFVMLSAVFFGVLTIISIIVFIIKRKSESKFPKYYLIANIGFTLFHIMIILLK